MTKKEIVIRLRGVSIELLDIKYSLESETEKRIIEDAFNSLNSLTVKLNKQF